MQLFFPFLYYKTSSQYSVLPGVNEKRKEEEESNRYYMMANKRVKAGEVFTMIMVKHMLIHLHPLYNNQLSDLIILCQVRNDYMTIRVDFLGDFLISFCFQPYVDMVTSCSISPLLYRKDFS